MALGDCYTHLCASPLEFDSLLTGLFAENTDGCVGMKMYLDLGTAIEDPCEYMTLQELILSSLVEDGLGGYGLRAIQVLGTPECYPCAEYDDIEPLLKSLFAKQGDCYGLKYYSGATGCENISSFASCNAQSTVEQLIKHAVAHDSTYGNYLVINQLNGACDSVDCQLNLTWAEIMGRVINSLDGECYGLMNLQSVTNTRATTSVQECGHYLSFEDALRASVTEVVCGLAFNVLLLNVNNGELT